MQQQYSDEELVAYCGINCKDCRAHSERRLLLIKYFKESLQELPLELFSKIIPQFKNIKQIMEFLDFLPQLGGTQTCCTFKETPCGKPDCEIRTCVKVKGIRTCAECGDYATCSKLDFLKPGHPTLISDLDFIKEKGFDTYVKEVVSKFKMEPLVIE